MTYPPTCRRRIAWMGFSLVELLVVLAVLGVVASLFFPALRKVHARANQSACAANLRQIGTAVLLYAGDNHGQLPGPLYNGQGKSGGGQLVTFLEPYLNVAPGDEAGDLFECPAWVEAAEGREELRRPYYMLPIIWTDGSLIRPFGYPSQNDPLRLQQIPDLSAVQAIIDFDRGVSSSSSAIEEPVHDSSRNVLFFDGHVDTIPVSEWTFPRPR